MRILRDPELDAPGPCAYLTDRQKQFEYFFAVELTGDELSALLRQGWRKFGVYYFRPRCPGCRDCIPLRVSVAEFSPSRSQRRVLRRNRGLSCTIGPLQFSEEAFAVYQAHSLERFGQQVSLDEFFTGFFQPSAPALQLSIRLEDGALAGVGFLDRGSDCLSSVYFCFDPRHEHLGLGTFSVLKEIELARSLGLPWYYLGYYVPGCPAMTYKDRFLPRQHYHWQSGAWRDMEGPSGE